MNNDYARAIEVLMNGAVDYRKVSIELAKQDPSLFLAIIGNCNSNQISEQLADYEVVQEMVALMRADNLVGAIKRLRELTGFSLKDAKDTCDRFRLLLSELRIVGPSPRAVDLSYPLGEKCQAILDRMTQITRRDYTAKLPLPTPFPFGDA